MKKQEIDGIEYVEDDIPGYGKVLTPRWIKSKKFLLEWLDKLPKGDLFKYCKTKRATLFIAKTAPGVFHAFYQFDDIGSRVCFNSGGSIPGCHTNLTADQVLLLIQNELYPTGTETYNKVVDFITVNP